MPVCCGTVSCCLFVYVKCGIFNSFKDTDCNRGMHQSGARQPTWFVAAPANIFKYKCTSKCHLTQMHQRMSSNNDVEKMCCKLLNLATLLPRNAKWCRIKTILWKNVMPTRNIIIYRSGVREKVVETSYLACQDVFRMISSTRDVVCTCMRVMGLLNVSLHKQSLRNWNQD